MTMYQAIGTASDRIMSALISGLEIEFGPSASRALAVRFLEAEEVDFHWDARVQERWLGAYECQDDEKVELDRIAVCGRLDDQWYCAICIVDGDGAAHGLSGKRIFSGEAEARIAWSDAH